MPANRTRVTERKPWQNAILVVDVLAGHLSCLSPKLKRFLADGAVGIDTDVGVGNLDGRHRLDCSLRCRRMGKIPPATTGELDLGELLQKPIESRSHQKIGDAGRKRTKASTGAVVIVELEATRRRSAVTKGFPIGRPAEDNDRVEDRPFTTGGATARAGVAER